ncbi:hypothetical protein MY11210_009389 [Beauveria gryllotalpidicola]
MSSTMSRHSPHHRALFTLVPRNDRAMAVLNHPDNAHHISAVSDDGKPGKGLYGLDIGLHIGSKSRYTLATIGRCGDIIVEGLAISRIQCSFEINEDNKEEIMLQDRSTNKSTQFFGETAMPFEPGRPHRRVVIDPTVNLDFGFGGAACDLYRFRIIWHERTKLAADIRIKTREDNPRQTRTILDEPLTVAPSRPITRIHTPGNLQKIRYSKRQKLGSGAFGEVWKAANVDSGEYLAVKRVTRPALLSHAYVMLKREVETLSRVSHRNIVEYIAAQWDEKHLDIIMELKPGSVEDLIRDDFFTREPTLASPLLHQMLQALDYLAGEGIIHRDVKPENILYMPLPAGSYVYQLADFGLANIVADAQTFAGSRIYMAPELDYNPEAPQTPKMDVWSLFVTLAYALNAGGFREKPLHSPSLRIKAVEEAANTQIFQPIRDMAKADHNLRATAADMLDKLFAGEGRTTPSNQIRAAAIDSDNAGPGPSEQCIEPDTVSKKRSKEPIVAERPLREAAAAARGSRPEQLPRPAVQLPALEAQAVDLPVQKRRRQADELRSPGAFPITQRGPEERPRLP